jgi:hypothetical protein
VLGSLAEIGDQRRLRGNRGKRGEGLGTTLDNLEATAFAEGTKGDKVRDLSEAVQSVINLKDGSIYGFTNVYLEGERAFVRSEETNLGNLSADANAEALQTLWAWSRPVMGNVRCIAQERRRHPRPDRHVVGSKADARWTSCPRPRMQRQESRRRRVTARRRELAAIR